MIRHHYNLGLFFDELAATHAERPALRYEPKTYSYAVLADWADRLATLLLARGLQRGDVIAIGHEKQPLSYALMLAALRLGVPYVNIDVASPLARSSRILEASGALLLFCDDPAYVGVMAELAATHGCSLIVLNEVILPTASEVDRSRQLELCQSVDGACVAYIMYTSGSTGIPKGVAVTHQNVLHFIEWGKTRFGVTEQAIFANLSPMYFDNSVFDFYVGLFSGAALAPVARGLLTDPYALCSYVGQMRCTIWFSVPSLLIYLMAMKAMTTEGLPELRCIVFGGEGYPKVELNKLFRIFSRQASLVNVYGPTECTCICSAHTLTEQDFDNLAGLPTLGRLNPNFDYSILDESGRDAVQGELCLIGPNVASGYFNDPERTTTAFFTLTDPGRYGKRMYRTGDLVREEGGLLYFVGRKDNQIKHMGYRIELEEIERALAELPCINQAAVIYERTNAAYGKLIAFAASSEGLNEENILHQLAQSIPHYMLPNKLIMMQELPKNPNGKVDRHQLRAMLER